MLIRKGQRYRAKEDIGVLAVTQWRAPYTGGARILLPQGEIVVIVDDPQQSATGVGCRPEKYDDILPLLPEHERGGPQFAGYILVIPFEVLSASFDFLH